MNVDELLGEPGLIRKGVLCLFWIAQSSSLELQKADGVNLGWSMWSSLENLKA